MGIRDWLRRRKSPEERLEKRLPQETPTMAIDQAETPTTYTPLDDSLSTLGSEDEALRATQKPSAAERPTMNLEALAGATIATDPDATMVTDPTGTMSASNAQLDVGIVLNDRYIVRKKLGEGGMGSVWLADDTHLDREVVLKTVKKADEHYLSLLRAEAQAAAKIEHENIGRIYDFVQDVLTQDGTNVQPMMIQEFIKGGKTLDEACKDMPIERVHRVVESCLRGLNAAHEKGIVHRDIKPSNIMMTPDGVVKILDFGLAKKTEELTGSGLDISGTIAYMSPEQMQSKNVGPLTDIYSLALTTFAVIERRSPRPNEPRSIKELMALAETCAPYQLSGKPPGPLFSIRRTSWEAVNTFIKEGSRPDLGERLTVPKAIDDLVTQGKKAGIRSKMLHYVPHGLISLLLLSGGYFSWNQTFNLNPLRIREAVANIEKGEEAYRRGDAGTSLVACGQAEVVLGDYFNTIIFDDPEFEKFEARTELCLATANIKNGQYETAKRRLNEFDTDLLKGDEQLTSSLELRRHQAFQETEKAIEQFQQLWDETRDPWIGFDLSAYYGRLIDETTNKETQAVYAKRQAEQFTAVIDYLEDRIERYRKNELTLLDPSDFGAMMYGLLERAESLRKKGDLSTASSLIERAHDIAEKRGDNYYVGVAQNYAGTLAMDNGDYAEAERLALGAIEKHRALEITGALAADYELLGNARGENGQPMNAVRAFNMAIVFFGQSGNNRELSDALYNRNNSLLKLGRIEQVIRHAKQGEQHAIDTLRNEKQASLFAYNLVEAALYAGDLDLAEESFERMRALRGDAAGDIYGVNAAMLYAHALVKASNHDDAFELLGSVSAEPGYDFNRGFAKAFATRIAATTLSPDQRARTKQELSDLIADFSWYGDASSRLLVARGIIEAQERDYVAAELSMLSAVEAADSTGNIWLALTTRQEAIDALYGSSSHLPEKFQETIRKTLAGETDGIAFYKPGQYLTTDLSIRR